MSCTLSYKVKLKILLNCSVDAREVSVCASAGGKLVSGMRAKEFRKLAYKYNNPKTFSRDCEGVQNSNSTSSKMYCQIELSLKVPSLLSHLSLGSIRLLPFKNFLNATSNEKLFSRDTIKIFQFGIKA